MSSTRRVWIGLVVCVLGLLVCWKLIAEIIEPHFLLWLLPRSQVLEVPALNDTDLRLYEDTRPYIGKIAGLQKGLVWVRGRRVLVEEGYGFGCPIVEFEGWAYNSRQAEIELVSLERGTRLIKRFYIDTMDTPIRLLRRKYRPVPSLGMVVVTYDVMPGGVIDVDIDLTHMEREWSRVYLMNEQGANSFTRYREPMSGLQLQAEEIGIWQVSDTFIPRACFDSDEQQLSFCVEPQEPARVYYGRERYNQYNWRGVFYLSWSGVDIEIESPRSHYRYRIVLEEM